MTAAAVVSPAQARSAAYALFARLVASPHEEPPPADLPEALAAVAEALPYPVAFEGLARAACGLDPAQLAREYAGLFESPEGLALREELARGEDAKVKEEVVRFYDYFGYALAPERAWAPDHLAVELEFLHYLAFRESHADRHEDRAPLARAQRDFLARHPALWCGALAVTVPETSAYLRTLFATLADWLERDRAWLAREALPED